MIKHVYHLRTSHNGMTLIEILIASVLSIMVLGTLQYMLFGSARLLSKMDEEQQGHSQWLVFREYFSSDVREASGIVEKITVNDEQYWTEADTEEESLILRLPSIDDEGQNISDVYDFIVYTAHLTEKPQEWVLTRKVFPNRNKDGDVARIPFGNKSVRQEEEKQIISFSDRPYEEDEEPSIFVLNTAFVSLAKEVKVRLLLEPERKKHPLVSLPSKPQLLTATFRLRNE